MTRGVIERRIALLERRKSVGDRVVHFKIAELAAARLCVNRAT
jgi:hypothetical protein